MRALLQSLASFGWLLWFFPFLCFTFPPLNIANLIFAKILKDGFPDPSILVPYVDRLVPALLHNMRFSEAELIELGVCFSFASAILKTFQTQLVGLFTGGGRRGRRACS
jgi:hypothetical protein